MPYSPTSNALRWKYVGRGSPYGTTMSTTEAR